MHVTELRLWLFEEMSNMSRKLKSFIVIIYGFAVLLACSRQKEAEEAAEISLDTVTVAGDSIDQATGLIVDEALPLVVSNCTTCHSAQLITQNRATREGWKSMIVWMQQTQNLWDLGANEDKILDYLARHYAPEQTGRRKNLENIEWYDLKGTGN